MYRCYVSQVVPTTDTSPFILHSIPAQLQAYREQATNADGNPDATAKVVMKAESFWGGDAVCIVVPQGADWESDTRFKPRARGSMVVEKFRIQSGDGSTPGPLESNGVEPGMVLAGVNQEDVSAISISKARAKVKDSVNAQETILVFCVPSQCDQASQRAALRATFLQRAHSFALVRPFGLLGAMSGFLQAVIAARKMYEILHPPENELGQEPAVQEDNWLDSLVKTNAVCPGYEKTSMLDARCKHCWKSAEACRADAAKRRMAELALGKWEKVDRTVAVAKGSTKGSCAIRCQTRRCQCGRCWGGL